MNLNKLFFIILIITSSLFSKEENLQKTTLQLAWKHQWQFAGYYMAKEKGFYKDAGFDVDIKEFNKGVHITNDVVLGKVDFGVGRSSLIYDRSEGKKVVMIASILQHSPIIILTKQRDDLKTVTDLKNKKIMLTQDQVGMASINSMLFSNGIKSDDFIFQQHSFNVQDLIDDKTDALLAYISNEPFKMKKQNIPYNVFSPRDYNFDFLSDILFTSENYLNKNPKKVNQFRKASLKGWRYAIENPKETTKLILEKYNTQNKTKEALEYESQEIIKLTDFPLIPLGDIDLKRIEYITQIYRLMGLINGDVSYKDLVYEVPKEKQIKLTQTEKAWIKSNPTIKVHNEMNWPPFNFNEYNTPKGYSVDLIKLVAKNTGLKIEFVTGPTWDQFMEQIKKGELDLIINIVKNDERSKYMLFTEPFIQATMGIAVHNDRKDINRFNDILNKKVALEKGFFYHDYFNKNHPATQLELVNDGIQTLQSVAYKKADATIGIIPVMKYIADKNYIPDLNFFVDTSSPVMQSMPVRFATRKDSPELLSILQKGLASITPKEQKELNERWLGKESKQKIKLTKKEQNWLKKNKSLDYVYDIDWAPFEWKNDLGEHTGIIFDILTLIEKRSGIKFKEISTEKWGDAVELMKKGKADMYSGVGENPERNKYLNFTKNTVFKTPYVFVARENDKSDYLETFKVIRNKKVAVVEGYTIHGILKENIPRLPLLTVKNTTEGFKKVRSGELDIFIVNAPTAKYFINRKGYDNLKIATKTEFNLELKIALQKTIAPEALSILDKTIKTITEQELSDIYFKWTEVQIQKLVDWDLIIKIFGGVFVLILGILYWNRTMAKEIAKRKQAELDLTNQKLLFEKLFSAAPDAITLLKGDGSFSDCNDAALSLFGIESKEKFLTIKPNDLSPQMQPDGILSNDAVMLRINEAFEKGKASFEWLHIRPDNNQTFFADVVLAPFMYQDKPLIYAIIRDITDRKEAERLIQKQKEEIEKILSNILLPVLITSKKDRTILYANSYAQIQYETSIEDMLGSSIDELYSTNGQQEHILKILEKQGRVENIEEIFKTKSGKEFTALLSVTPIEYQSQEAFIGMVTDITKIKEIENEIRQLHKHTKESIEYASMIQYALVPSDELFKSYFKDFFTIWEPKDIVGGDIYLFEELRNEDESLLLVIDCTGHGVPGAFVTMLVKAIERQITSKIILEQIEISPAEILSIFNKSLKQLLKQEDKSSTSNAGFDGQVLYYNKKDKIVKCASARNEIFYIQDNEVKKIKGDRFSVGYRDSDANYTFKEHTIDVSIPTSLYISSDGYWDQLGGEKELSFGKKRIMKIIEEIHEKPMEEQKDIFYNTIIKYQANLDRQDDITFIGIKI